MDVLLGKLLANLSSLNLLDKMNIIIVSDHGMTQLKDNKIIPLDRYVDLNLIDANKTIYGIVTNIYPTSSDKVYVFKYFK